MVLLLGAEVCWWAVAREGVGMVGCWCACRQPFTAAGMSACAARQHTLIVTATAIAGVQQGG